MAGWIRRPRMDVHIAHRPSPVAQRKRCRSQPVPSPVRTRQTPEAQLELLWSLPAPHAATTPSHAWLIVPTSIIFHTSVHFMSCTVVK